MIQDIREGKLISIIHHSLQQFVKEDARTCSGQGRYPEQECNTSNGFRLFSDEILVSGCKLLENEMTLIGKELYQETERDGGGRRGT